MNINYNPYSLSGKTILVTGASSGIGKSAAIESSKLGAQVIITARSEERLKQTFDSLEGEGHMMKICDLNDSTQIEAMVKELPELQGVINNAGFTKILPIPFIDEESLKSILQVDTVAPILVLKNLLKKKKLKSGASVVFTSSMAGLGKATVGNTMYTACKGAISAFVQGAALELAPKGIRVNAVCPAMVDTGILDSGTITSEQLEADKQNYPLGRYGKPQDIAWAMVYLLSDASNWVTGINMIIDGGYSVK